MTQPPPQKEEIRHMTPEPRGYALVGSAAAKIDKISSCIELTTLLDI
ncbi:uncharacterized protein RAG0_04820 [Rhynchosporium agropyri]|nr:uncharacterized protein RAG0_04820 [Rhynchosporium agropyri]CZT00170.1 uncharacterized protein RCO7_14584 [Rhynchosporium commune]